MSKLKYVIFAGLCAFSIGLACEEVKDNPYECYLDIVMANGKKTTIVVSKDFYEALMPGAVIEYEHVNFRGKKTFMALRHEWHTERERSRVYIKNEIQLNEQTYVQKERQEYKKDLPAHSKEKKH
jgi:hypothetical protein